MEDARDLPPKRRARRFEKAGMAIVVLVLAIIVVVFVGRNLWHADVEQKQPETTAPSAV